ncbi:MAG: DUF721 domain-containing protein [Solirubrobacteraceae bacterium]
MTRARAHHRSAPRPISVALEPFTGRLSPGTGLAAAQRAWPQLEALVPAARGAVPSGLRDGVLTVTCPGAVWAHELQWHTDEVLACLDAALGAGEVRALRVRSS